MTTKKVKLSDTKHKKGKSRKEFLENISADEIRKRALDDPDNPPLTDDELKELRPVEMEDDDEKNKN